MMIPDWMLLLITLAIGGLLLFFSVVRIVESPISQTAKAVWVLIVLVVPLLGPLLPFAVLPKPEDDPERGLPGCGERPA